MASAGKKRGWRNISVAEKPYRWCAKYYGYPGIIYVHVLLADAKGQRLLATFDEDRIITPKVIEYTITSAIKAGWFPESSRHEVFEMDGDALIKGTEHELDHPPNSKGPW